MRPILLLLLGFGLLLTAPAGRALAHAELVGSEPADGATLEAPPPAITLRFSEPVTPIRLRLVGPTGAPMALPEPPRPVGSELTLPLPPGLGHGSHTLSWRVRSADGHPIAGSLVLSIGHVTGAAPASAEGPAWPATVEPFAQTLFYAGALGAVGLTLFGLLIGPSPPSRRELAATFAMAAIGGVVAVLCRGCALLGTGPLEPGAFVAGWASPLGARIGLALPGLAALAAARGRAVWGALGLVATLLAFPLAGHTASAMPRWPWAMALVLHVGLAAFWLGAFWPLLRLLQRRPATEAAPVVRRFSRLATFAVPLLLAAGALLACHELDRLSALWASAYGRLLGLKLALVMGLLALAALNRLRLGPALAAGEPWAGRSLRRSILAETALAALVLLVTAALGATSPHDPARHAGHAAMPAARTLELSEGTLRAVLRLEPGRAGPNRVELTLADAAGHPAPALEAELALAAPEAGIEPLTRPLQPAGPGRFTAEGLVIPAPGHWRLTLSLLVSDFERASLAGEIELP